MIAICNTYGPMAGVGMSASARVRPSWMRTPAVNAIVPTAGRDLGTGASVVSRELVDATIAGAFLGPSAWSPPN